LLLVASIYAEKKTIGQSISDAFTYTPAPYKYIQPIDYGSGVLFFPIPSTADANEWGKNVSHWLYMHPDYKVDATMGSYWVIVEKRTK
jgi:hypothetical protein